jgi:hypothetical protein
LLSSLSQSDYDGDGIADYQSSTVNTYDAAGRLISSLFESQYSYGSTYLTEITYEYSETSEEEYTLLGATQTELLGLSTIADEAFALGDAPTSGNNLTGLGNSFVI